MTRSIDIQEIFGFHYELAELGPLGASGLANPRDFEHPIAHFDIDQTPWEREFVFTATASTNANIKLHSHLQVCIPPVYAPLILTSTYRLGGQLFTCKQEHTPFDVVAWHGK